MTDRNNNNVKVVFNANRALSQLKKIIAKIDNILSSIDKKKASIENKHSGKLESLNSEKERLEKELENYAIENKHILNDSRSFQYRSGTLQFTASKRLVFLDNKTAPDIIARIQQLKGGFKKYIIPKPSLDSKNLKADIISGNLTASQAKKIHCAVEDFDNFSIKIN